MRKHHILLAASVVVFIGLSSTVEAQGNAKPTTFEGSHVGGWSGPCEAWWSTSGFSLDAVRICRVTTNLITAFQRTADAEAAKRIANELFRICWGAFPSASNSCGISNAWTTPRGWIDGTKRPVVITLKAIEDLQSDDEIAFVLGHEMGHAADRVQSVNGNTPQNEERADTMGIGFVMRAGYDARSAGRGLQMILGERGRGLVGNLLGMLEHAGDGADPHGLARDRIARMKQTFARGCAALNNQAVGCREGWR